MKTQRGQSIAEFALIGGAVCVILFIIIYFCGKAMEKNAPELAYTLDQITFKANKHALEKHPEALSVESCLNSKGPYQVWRDRNDKNTFYALCNMDNGKWGLAACTASGANKTMFSPKEGTRDDIFSYVSRYATRYLLGLPADCK